MKFIILLCLLIALVYAYGDEPKHLISVPKEYEGIIEDEEVHENEDRLYYLVNEADYAKYRNFNGLIHHFSRGSDDDLMSNVENSVDKQEYRIPGGPMISTRIPKGYHSLDEINAIMKRTAKKYRQIAAIEDIAKKYGPGSSVEGRPIYAMRISSNLQDTDRPAILIASCHHSREIITPEIALDIIQRLTAGSRTNPWIKKIIQTYTIFVIPVVNVDGLDFVWKKNNWWRKNRRQTSDNSFGIDLNRQYPLGWGQCGGTFEKDSETYKGEKPLTEPEVQSIVSLYHAFNFAKVLDFHSSGRQILNRYQCRPMPSKMQQAIVKRGEELANLIDYGSRSPSSDGEHQEYAIMNHTSYSYLVETGEEFQPPYEQCVAEIKRVWPLVRKFLETPIPITGHVFDSNTEEPIVAVIENPSARWLSSEIRHSGNQGRFHYWPFEGKQVLIFKAPGYADHKEVIDYFETDSPRYIQIAMQKL